MLLYSLLHLTGYDLRSTTSSAFRQWGSLTPGHPEYGLTPGVEATTGPLGQGFANGVGMAIAERRLAAEFNRPGHAVIDHRTYGICSRRRPPGGDRGRGGVARRPPAARQARRTSTTTTGSSSTGPPPWPSREDVLARFDAYGWHTQPRRGRQRPRGDRGRDRAPRGADARPSRSSRVRTHIGFGSPHKQDSQKAHGAPLGDGRGPPHQGGLRLGPGQHASTCRTRSRAVLSRAIPYGEELVGGLGRAAWRRYARRLPGARPPSWRDASPATLPGGWRRGAPGLRGRQRRRAPGTRARTSIAGARGGAAGAVRRVGRPVRVQPDRRQGRPTTSRPTRPAATSGSACASTRWAASRTASPTTAASCRTCATFLTFSDYMRGSVRLAALSGLHVIYVWTHDSVGLGEDGPTHQPVEHYAALRAIPNLWFVRPGDGNEAAAAWALAVERPATTAPSRSPSPARSCRRSRARPSAPATACARGGYVAHASRPAAAAPPAPILIAHRLRAPARDRARPTCSRPTASATRVVSLPCWELFERQDAAYRDAVLPPSCASASRWRPASRSAGSAGPATRARSSGIDRFGASAPGRHDLRAVRVHVERRGRCRPGRRPRRAPRTRGPAHDRPPTTGAGHRQLREAPMRIAFAADHAGRRAARTSCSRGSPAVRATSCRPRRRRLGSRTTTTRTSRAPGPGHPRRAGGPRHPRLRLRRRRVRRRQQDRAASGRPSATTRTPRTRAWSTTT